MKALAPIRASLGIRTVFNLLGPLTNPAAPRYLLVGAYDAATAELMAGTLAGMRIERGWVVHGASGWDEATPIGSFVAFDIAGGAITRREIDPEELGLAPLHAARSRRRRCQSQSESADRCVRRTRRVGPHLDTLVLQCGLALMISGPRTIHRPAAWRSRAPWVDSGKALAWMQRLRAFAQHSANARVT